MADAVAEAEAKMRELMNGAAAERAEQAQRRRREMLERLPPTTGGMAPTSPGVAKPRREVPPPGGGLRPGGGMRPGGLRPGGMMRPPAKPETVSSRPPSLLTLSDQLGVRVLSHVGGGDARALAWCRLACKRMCLLADRATRRLQHQKQLECLLEEGTEPLERLLGRWPGLIALSVDASFALNDAHLRALPAGICSGLTSVCISRCWGVSQLWPAHELMDRSQPGGSNPGGAAVYGEADSNPADQGGLPSLRSLSVHGCEGLGDISGLRFSRNLTTLDLGACAGITDLSVLSQLVSLTRLNLEGCPALDDDSIATVGGLPALQFLNISWCRRLSDVTALSGCSRLREVVAVGNRLKKDGLEMLRSALGESCKIQLMGGLRKPR
eukprot:COSAG03_NODE_303_length_9184_cov_67.131535_3_plen_383_part_00